MPQAVIAEAVPTPIGKRNGSLADVHATDLGALVLRELFDRTGIDPADVDDARWGCVSQVGGAIAAGHALGASGAIFMTRLINQMRDGGIRFGLQTMCEGGGAVNATIVELIDE